MAAITTERQIKALSTTERSKHALGGGLVLHVRPRRREPTALAWYYRDQRDGDRLVKLGTYPELGLKAARAAAAVKAGTTPAIRGRLTVAELAEQWLASGDARGLQAETMRHRRRYVEKHIGPHLGKMAAADVRRSDVVAMVDRLLAQTGARSDANALVGNTGTMFRWGLDRDLVQQDATRGLSKRNLGGVDRSNTRDRTLEDDNELRELWHCGGPHEALYRTALLTGLRARTLVALRWDWVHNERIGPIPKEAMKHEYPGHWCAVPPLLADVLASIPSDRGPRLFPQHSLTATKWLREVHQYERQGYAKGETYTLHDLRRTFITRCSDLPGSSEGAVKLMAAHRSTGTHARYNRAKHERLRVELANAWAGELQRIVA